MANLHVCMLASLVISFVAAECEAAGEPPAAPLGSTRSERVFPWNGRPIYGDAELRTLHDDLEIVSLPLSHSQITDAGIKYLKGMRNLKELSLIDTRISDDGLRILQSQSHPKLESLALEGTRVTDKGLYYVGRMTTLRSLGVNEKTTDAGLKNLLPLTHLEHLAIGDNSQLTDVGMGFIGQLSQLTTLEIGSDRVTDAGLANLGRLKRLFNLRLRCKQMSDPGMMALKDIKHLGSLYVDSDRITGAGFAALAGHGGMNALFVRGGGVADEGMKHLRGIDFIGELTLPSDKITDAGLAELEGMAIGKLDIGGSRIADAGLEHLQHVYGLHSLNLLRNAIKGPGLKCLKALPTHQGPREVPKLSTLYLSNVTDAGLKVISEIPSICDLVLIDPKMRGRRIRFSQEAHGTRGIFAFPPGPASGTPTRTLTTSRKFSVTAIRIANR